MTDGKSQTTYYTAVFKVEGDREKLSWQETVDLAKWLYAMVEKAEGWRTLGQLTDAAWSEGYRLGRLDPDASHEPEGVA